jgi:hypothetical protein
MAAPAQRLATYADLEAVPPYLVAEIIHGALVTHPRPAPGMRGRLLRSEAASALGIKMVSAAMLSFPTSPDGGVNECREFQ